MIKDEKITCPRPMPPPWIDPWLTTDPRCQTCKYHVVSVEGNPKGRCRRHAPTVEGYPMTYTFEDWCGDHKERKIIRSYYKDGLEPPVDQDI
jgi:hypothetical protein